MKEVVISIDETTGELSFVHDTEIMDVVAELGGSSKERATRIEPVNRFWRCLFYLIRNRVDDSSFLAGLTRLMPCLWIATLVDNGYVIGTDRNRKRLIQKEIEYLNDNRI